MSKWAELNIIGLLNGKPSGATERVSWIVEACQQIIQLHESMRLSHASHSSAPALDNHVLLADTGRILKELNARLAKYKCLPVVSYFASPDTCFYVQYMFLAASENAAPECVAISWVMRYIHAVHRIRRCRRPECRKWFFAVTDHQKYCGDNCRKREAQQGLDFKRKRADYMKKYRSEEAERNERAKRLVKGKSK